MATLFLYILGASPDPDRVQCVVPYPVNDELIFFGPCKRPLRQNLKEQYLRNADEVFPKEELYLVGFNARNARRIRKIVWAGEIRKLMTFENAHNTLISPEFNHMRSHPYSPLHVKPIYDSGGDFVGYEHASKEHEGDWYADLLHGKDHPDAYARGRQLLLRPGANRHQVFVRDCCFLCNNIFFARGQGLTITDGMLTVLKKAQPGKQVDPYAIFGYTANGAMDGKRNCLTLTGTLADEFLSNMKRNSLSPLQLNTCEGKVAPQVTARKARKC